MKTNLAFVRRILSTPAFANAELDTGFIERHAPALLPDRPALTDEFWAQAAQAYLNTSTKLDRPDDPDSPWSQTTGWRMLAAPQALLHLRCGAEDRLCVIAPAPFAPPHGFQLLARRGEVLYLDWLGDCYEVTKVDPLAEAAGTQAGDGGLAAPMNGSIVRVLVAPGQPVQAGDALIVVEAMKMEHSIRAPRTGVISAVFCSEGEMVAEGAVLVELEEVSDDAA